MEKGKLFEEIYQRSEDDPERRGKQSYWRR